MRHNLTASGIKTENMQIIAAVGLLVKISRFFKKRRQSCASVEPRGFIRTGSRWPPLSFKNVSIMVFYRIALRERKEIRKKKRMDK